MRLPINDEERLLLIEALEDHMTELRDCLVPLRGNDREGVARQITKSVDLLDRLRGLTHENQSLG